MERDNLMQIVILIIAVVALILAVFAIVVPDNVEDEDEGHENVAPIGFLDFSKTAPGISLGW